MKILKYFFVSVLLFAFINLSADEVKYTDALTVAKNCYFEKTGIAQSDIELIPAYNYAKSENHAYYIFNEIKNGGFIIVSADDAYTPIIAYAKQGLFVTDNMPNNILYWMDNYTQQIEYLRSESMSPTPNITKLWNRYITDEESFIPSNSNTKGVAPMTDGILWNQDDPWNDLCPDASGGPGGHAYAGCVATAMSIVMKYWDYPLHGENSHSYYHPAYGTISADFGNSTYFWNLMDETQGNLYSAQLMFHCGVAVNMNYTAGGSGAYSGSVDNALIDYFGYSSSTIFVERSDYSTDYWTNNIIKADLDEGRPIYYSGRDNDDGGHAFVCDGYDDSDNFHFNFGWSGSNNGFYTLSNVGGFMNGQAAVINIEPAESNTYPEMPQEFSGEVSLDNTDEFQVDLSWNPPTNKSVTGYKIFRDLEEVAELGNDVTDYSDFPEVNNYNYVLQTIYSDGESMGAYALVEGLFNIIFKVKDPADESEIYQAQVDFNGEQVVTGFMGASFIDVAFGVAQLYTITKDGYPTTSGYLDVMDSETVIVYMDGAQAAVENIQTKSFEIYPNPAVDYLNVKSENTQNTKFRIIDITGKIVQSGSLSRENKILLEQKDSGFYFIQFENGVEIQTKSFIIK